MHVLVTRPEGDGEALKTRIEQLGCKASLEPLIRLVPDAVPLSAIEEASALIVTSRNALRALSTSPALQLALTLPLIVVGPATAAMALEMGFQNVFEGAGTAADLVSEIVRRSREESGVFVYLSGDVLAFDLPAALRSRNVDIRSVVAYRSVPARSLSPRVIEALTSHEIDVVILMSPRTAEIWAQLAYDLLPQPDLSGITYVCLSEAIAGVLKSHMPVAKVEICARPNLEEMFAVLKRLAGRSEAE
jgi:uroporphyrinogen-III synthase